MFIIDILSLWKKNTTAVTKTTPLPEENFIFIEKYHDCWQALILPMIG